jgi:putative DNA primase/helicase
VQQQAARDPYVVPDEIKQRFVQIGKKYHFPDGARAFTDHGNRLTSTSENAEVINSLISIAQARGWSDITISGTERFKKEVWFAARVAGLDVRGYSPTDFEQGRLIRMLARVQAPAPRPAISDSPATASLRSRGGSVMISPHADDSRAQERAAPRESQRSLQVGRLVDHGAAHYLHDPRNDRSYFVRIETPSGEREIWGVDLQRALKESLTRPQIGDEIGLRALRQDAVKISRREYDDAGRVVGEKELGASRNAWIVEKRDFFRERAQASRVLRDPNVDRQAAVKQHPELLGTYLQLHAAELAAKTLHNPEDQRRFVASVRTALADAVARGEPLATVPLKETAAQRQEPRMRSASAVPERDAAPTR